MISIRAVSRRFLVGDHRVDALREVDLEVHAGEYLAIMGPSGSGKSTLLHILGLLDRPTSGTYLLDGQDVSGIGEKAQSHVRREKIGFVFQFFHLVPRLTAAQNVELPMLLAGMAPAERRRRVDTALEAFGLTDRAGHRPDELSGGQRQRVAIARATILEPAVLLADEPTGNLDQTTGEEVLDLLEVLWRQGLTLLVVTHNPEIGDRAARTIRLIDGRIVEDRRNGGPA